MASLRLMSILLLASLASTKAFIFPIFIKTIDLDSLAAKWKNPFYTPVESWRDTSPSPPAPAIKSNFYPGFPAFASQQRFVAPHYYALPPPTVQNPPLQKEDAPVIVGQGHVY